MPAGTPATVLRNITPARTARAEAKYKAELRATAEATTVAERTYTQQHDASERLANEARMAIVHPYTDLGRALSWFKSEWQAALPVTIQTLDTELNDALGGPAYTGRFRSYLFAEGDETRDPIRVAMRAMSHGQLFDRCGSLFLFLLACQDFQLEDAGMAMRGHCIHPPVFNVELKAWMPEHVTNCPAASMPIFREYVGWYAQKAIDRLREYVLEAERRRPRALPEPDWKRRAGISESQAVAEATGT